MQKQQRLMGVLIVIIVAIGVAISNGQNSTVDSTGRTESFQVPATIETARPRTSSQPRASSRPTESANTRQQQTDGFATIAYDDLPREAKLTIDLIQQDGPFPYDQDGSVFRNREGLLPQRPNGYYREYTVETPGSDDRGARRIVAGDDGELYYTDDHYDSFSRVR